MMCASNSSLAQPQNLAQDTRIADSNVDSCYKKTSESKVDSEVVNAVGQPTASNQSHEVQTQSRPLRGAQNRNQGGSSASADFGLEAEVRGSPLDCRKSGGFFGVKGSGEGINPFLRKNENGGLDSELSRDISATPQYDKVSESSSQTNAATQKANSSIADEVRGLSKNCAETSLKGCRTSNSADFREIRCETNLPRQNTMSPVYLR